MEEIEWETKGGGCERGSGRKGSLVLSHFVPPIICPEPCSQLNSQSCLRTLKHPVSEFVGFKASRPVQLRRAYPFSCVLVDITQLKLFCLQIKGCGQPLVVDAGEQRDASSLSQSKDLIWSEGLVQGTLKWVGLRLDVCVCASL